MDEKRKPLKHANDLFANREYEETRRELIAQCEQLMLGDFEVLGRKARDILWRKGFYDPISVCRKVAEDEVEARQKVRTIKICF